MPPHRQQPTRLPRPWDSPGKNTGVGCHFLLHCMKVNSESEVTQSYPTLWDPMDCSPPGSSVHVLSEHLEKSHFPEFLAVKESHTTEIWSLECGWKWRMSAPGLVLKLPTESTFSSILLLQIGFFLFLFLFLFFFLRSWVLEEPPEGKFPITRGKIAHFPLNPLIHYHVSVRYVVVCAVNKI